MKLIKNFNKPSDTDSIIVICVIRDEELLIPAFLNHYRKLSATHFIFIDNGSEDGSLDYLNAKAAEFNIQIWQTKEGYAENMYGVAWVNKILSLQCKNKWCLVVDIDELVLLKNKQTMQDIRDLMIDSGSNILQTCLIDFYPKSFSENSYKQHDDPFIHSPCFDKFSNDSIFTQRALDGSKGIKGGLRHRMLNTDSKPTNDSVCLTKKSFFKYDFFNSHHLEVGMHWILPNEFKDWDSYDNWTESNKFLKFFKNIVIIAHFKFIKPNIKSFFQQRIDRNQDWNNSSEYKQYANSLSDSFYKEGISLFYEDPNQVYVKTCSHKE